MLRCTMHAGQAAAASSTAVTRTAAARPWEQSGSSYNSPASAVGKPVQSPLLSRLIPLCVVILRHKLE